MSDFRGSFTVAVTPFTEDGEGVDLEALRRFIDWQLEEDVPGLILLGSSGEFLSVADDERQALVQTAVEHVAGRIPVLVGTANTHTPTAVRYSREAIELGADGLMISPPYYVTPTEGEIAEYYRAICAAVDAPIMLYNNPHTTHVDMSAELVGRLTKEHEQIRYIKEASTDVARVYDVLEQTDGVMNVFAGERIVESYLLGAVGYVNPFGNYAPRPSRVICDLLADGRVAEAKEIEVLLDEIDRVLQDGHPLYGYQCYSKGLAAAAGHPMGDVRPPLRPFASLGAEGDEKMVLLRDVIGRLDAVTARIEAAAPVAG
jgi:4-hydroxy-tetrahydrodipicolinate synthase